MSEAILIRGSAQMTFSETHMLMSSRAIPKGGIVRIELMTSCTQSENHTLLDRPSALDAR